MSRTKDIEEINRIRLELVRVLEGGGTPHHLATRLFALGWRTAEGVKATVIAEVEDLADGLCCGGVLWERADQLRDGAAA